MGDSVSVDEVICNIETDKTSVPVSSRGGGVFFYFLVFFCLFVRIGIYFRISFSSKLLMELGLLISILLSHLFDGLLPKGSFKLGLFVIL